MTAMNVVRMRVKPGRESDFVELHKSRDIRQWSGMRSLRVVKTGEREYVIVGEWDDMDALAAARPQMVEILDSFRGDLENLGDGLGETDPRSGEVVVDRTV
ncbi:antibiotic biosynthesis monooxygenase [Defluviimonas sp. WL0002]|uniref:Antibiotic biosynthesis monooxygenase n=1 Tax=Albidovulum marisflavi TaxID=2984159 RepID=A0ABT2ZCT2_9RHOB|nr:antibiotic biosynthesis monooxygenase [Defluviimonas sp. WL0002]MCV2868955.1 antibiotic biosynthesis monooxygenase [Defluviimonas sp. WL0002]